MIKRTCLITGASRGLGKFLSGFFAKSGFDLILVSSDLESLEQASKEIRLALDQEILLIGTDLSKDGFEVEMFHKIDGFCNSIDILINCAAVQGPIGPFSDLEFKEWESAFRVNFLAPSMVCHKVIPFMDNNNGGTIINISGGGSSGLRPNFSAYASSKTALVRFTETIASELTSKNINVNAIAPGVMPTDMLKEVLATSEQMVGRKERDIARRAIESDFDMTDIGTLCLFLYESMGRKITGKLISVKWDNWEHWVDHLEELNSSDVYTLRRIVGGDRGIEWGDK